MTYLVIGGTGKSGRRVAAPAEGPRPARARSAPARARRRSTGTPTRTSWAPLLRGVDAAYITYHPDLAFPGAAESIRAFAEQRYAGRRTTSRAASGRGEEEAAGRASRAVRDCGAEWTVAAVAPGSRRTSTRRFLLPPVLAGAIALPTDVPEPFVDVEDVADVAVEALTERRARRADVRADRPAPA